MWSNGYSMQTLNISCLLQSSYLLKLVGKNFLYSDSAVQAEAHKYSTKKFALKGSEGTRCYLFITPKTSCDATYHTCHFAVILVEALVWSFQYSISRKQTNNDWMQPIILCTIQHPVPCTNFVRSPWLEHREYPACNFLPLRNSKKLLAHPEATGCAGFSLTLACFSFFFLAQSLTCSDTQ